MDNTLQVHFNSIVVDSHNDTMMNIIDDETWLPKINIGENTDNHIDIPKLVLGGLKVPFFAAFTSGYHDNIPKSISRTLALINALYWTEKKNLATFKIVRTVEGIGKTVKDGKISAVPTIEGGYSFNEDNAMELLRQYYDLGVKMVAFNWNYSNLLGEGCSRTYNDPEETPSYGGLTDLGKQLAIEMNKLGIIIDVSHMAEDTFWDIINTSKAPIIASHSGVYSLRNHPRNLRDDQLKALSKNGGVIGIVFRPGFLTDRDKAYIKDYADHIDYAVNLIGVDHVAIGSDFDGTGLPEDIKDSSELYKVTEELIKRGYKDEDIEKILGENILRVFKEVEDAREYKIKEFEMSLNIIPNFNMGEIIDNSTPLLSAKIENLNGFTVDELDFGIIIDGIPYSPKYDVERCILYFKIEEPLKERVHVITFELKNNKGEVQREKRETRIIYTK